MISTRCVTWFVIFIFCPACAFYPHEITPTKSVSKVKKKRFAELAVTFTELNWRGKRTGNVDVVRRLDLKTYMSLKRAAFRPFENSRSFHQVMDREEKRELEADIKLLFRIIDDGRASFPSRLWQWSSFLTLGIIPYYAKFRIGYELVVYDPGMKELGRFAGGVSVDYWQHLLLIYGLFSAKEKFVRIINGLAREAIQKFEASDI